ncbi:MAG TPA: hypothetical protein VLW84_03625 [Terriglobales bacterium]|nr:hypothetical protein [Terriglobales bacterium]
MTCQELHSYFEVREPVDFASWIGSAEVAEHILGCAGCAGFVEAHRQMERNLALVRATVPRVAPALDAAVLAHYRRYAARLSQAAGPTAGRGRRLFAALAWGAAIAAVALGAILFFPGRKTPSTSARPYRAPLIIEPQAQRPATPATASPTTKRKRAARAVGYPTRHEPAAIASVIPGPLPGGFHSLMYCDELSCAGAMTMIRVQLPMYAASFPSANGMVFADVLVGPDGIARGFRIVE